MGCQSSIGDICGDFKDSSQTFAHSKKKIKDILQDKIAYLHNTFLEADKLARLQQFITEKQCKQLLKCQQVGQKYLLQQLQPNSHRQLVNPISRSIWKLFIFEQSIITSPNPYTFQQEFLNPSPKQSQCFYEIGLDIKRTFPTDSTLNRQDLEIVLKNISIMFQGLGYTQGMNFFVALLLLAGFSKKQTFWFFCHLTCNTNFLIARNFTPGFKTVLSTVKILQKQMQNHQILNQVKQKVDQMGLTSFFYSFSWFLCYFAYSLQPRCCVLIWDYIFTNIVAFTHGSNQKNAEKNQLMNYVQRKCSQNRQYFHLILKTRGSFFNIIHICMQLLISLSPAIIRCQSPQDLMKILRNQTLINQIKVQDVMRWIGNCKQKKKIVLQDYLQLIKQYDLQLYQIMTTQKGYSKYIKQIKQVQNQRP